MWLVASFCLVLGSASAQVAQPAPTTPVETAELPIVRTDAQQVELFANGLFGGLIETRNLPGAVFVVVKDESVIFARGYGYADVETKRPIDPEKTLFRVASVSKLITATAAMEMVEDKKLRLDANVNDYLDTFKIPDTYPQPVTLHHLMTHTGGFDDLFRGTSAWPDGPDIPLGEFLAQSMPPRVMPPGEVINYSNMSWALTGYLVERASGRKFNEYVQQRIFEPLGMTHSRFGVSNPPPEDMATPYRDGGPTGLEKVGFDRDYMGPAAEFVTSGTDIARFMIAHLNKGIYEGRVILHPDTLELMHQQHFSNGPGLDGWAYGFWERRRNGWRFIGHDGSWRGFGSLLVLAPEARMGFFVSINKDYDPVSFRALTQSIADHLFPPREGVNVTPVVSADSPSPSADEISGTYISVRRVRSDFMKIAQLLSEVQISKVDDKRLRISGGDRPRDYIYVGNGLWNEDGLGQRRLSVIGRDGNAVTRVAFDQGAVDRALWYETGGFNNALAALAFIIALPSLIAWGLAGPARLRFAGAKSLTPLPLRLLIVAVSALIVAFFLIFVITMAIAYPMDVIVETPLSVRIAAWIPFLLLLLIGPLAYFVWRAFQSEGAGRILPILALLPLLAVLITLWFAWFWNIHAFAV
jgi:CubicO group peptidase (beta-lactamase class C family)